MAKIEVGKEYKNGRGQVISILAEAKNSEGIHTYLGVYKNTEYITGMDCLYYNENGTPALYGSILDNLEVFDWRSLKRDDVVEVVVNPDHPEDVRRRHVAYVTHDKVCVYRYGASSKTYSGDIDDIGMYSPEYILREVV